jgi:hypothetical protein
VVAGATRLAWWRCAVDPHHEWRVSLHDRSALTGGCPFCLDLRVCSTNSLAVTRPRIAAEWHSTKNGRLTPHDVVEGSARRVWWRCSRHSEHEWCALVTNRTLRGSGCPFCSHRQASAEHCLAIAYPQVASEWHPIRNGVVTPASVTPYARRTAWWLCASGHEWRTRINTRTRRRSLCPTCSRKTRVRASAPSVRPVQPRVGPRSITWDIREQHGRIEQILVLLDAEPGAEDPMLSRFAVDLTAHLEAEERILHPLLEGVLNRPLAAQRQLQVQMRHLLAQILPGRDGALRSDRLRELRAAFQEHARFEEQLALPALESSMDERSFEALGRKMRASRVTRAPRATREPTGQRRAR